MVGGGFVEGGQLRRAHLYEYRITGYFAFACIIAALGGSLFGYDLGVSGEVTSMDDFLKEFFPKVNRRKQEHLNETNYCNLTICERNGGELSAVDSEVKPEAPSLSGSLDDSRLKLRQEPAKLGDDPGYEDMPVEEFATAYLRGVLDGKRRKGWERTTRRMFRLDARLLCFLYCKFCPFFLSGLFRFVNK